MKLSKLELYIKAAYWYYWKDDPIMEDYEFDLLARELLRNYETEVKGSKWEGLVSEDDLFCGSLVLGEALYPEFARST